MDVGALTSNLAISPCDPVGEVEVAKKSRQELLLEAELRSACWLGRLQGLKELGITAGLLHEEAERKSRYWINRHDTLNRAE